MLQDATQSQHKLNRQFFITKEKNEFFDNGSVRPERPDAYKKRFNVSLTNRGLRYVYAGLDNMKNHLYLKRSFCTDENYLS